MRRDCVWGLYAPREDPGYGDRGAVLDATKRGVGRGIDDLVESRLSRSNHVRQLPFIDTRDSRGRIRATESVSRSDRLPGRARGHSKSQDS